MNDCAELIEIYEAIVGVLIETLCVNIIIKSAFLPEKYAKFLHATISSHMCIKSKRTLAILLLQKCKTLLMDRDSLFLET